MHKLTVNHTISVFVNQISLVCSITDGKTQRDAIYRNHPTFLLNIAPMTLFKRKIAANKSCENLLFGSGIHFHLIGMQNVSGARGFLSMKWFTKGEILHPVLILIYIGVLVRKQYVQKFLALSKNVSPPL